MDQKTIKIFNGYLQGKKDKEGHKLNFFEYILYYRFDFGTMHLKKKLQSNQFYKSNPSKSKVK